MNILHLKIPMNPKARKKDQFLITPKLLGEFILFLQEKLGSEFNIIASPCEPSMLSDSYMVYNFDMAQISLHDLKEMIKNERV